MAAASVWAGLVVGRGVARQAVCSGQNNLEGVRIALPQYVGGTTTWLSILHKSEHPVLKFDTLLGGCIEHPSDGRTSVVFGTYNNECFGTAVASNYVMESGVRYAEFFIIDGLPCMGIARPMPNLDTARFANETRFGFFCNYLYGDFLTERTDEWGDGNVCVCKYSSDKGSMKWTNWDGEGDDGILIAEGLDWEGMDDSESDDTIGMLLNLDEGTLKVYKNGRRLGVMKDGLSGPYCWYATMQELSEVSIKRSGARHHFLVDEVVKVICNLSTESESGVHVNDVVREVSQKGFSVIDIRNVISFLSYEGRIYSTIDEDHYLYSGV